MKKLLLFGALLSFVSTSCVMYHPHSFDIPLLEEKGDMHVDANAAITFPLLDGSGLNATFAWAPLNMLGVQAAGSISDDGNYLIQAAAGTYQLFGSTVLECYIGAATGHSLYDKKKQDNNESKTNYYQIGGQYNMFFSQINVGWNHIANDHINIGLGVKGGLLRPNWSKNNYNPDTDTWTLDFKYDTPQFVLEPQLMFRAGGEQVKFSLNIAYSFIPNWPTDNSHINYTRFSFGAGVHFKF